ncbi:hypothetical protein OIDMADRAFT_21191 [Oidiodendron maius Zn]|uniref:Cysteine-rich transmembrane CYSTM domain-containing protein n=1 Tax=Oidiodendron maius (strain Zn) TaxID=913774 RepID=A0A0C3GX46_OIDMZ|nr:hypothetical protein OIDMADRAFT_21191 [Oidiodendron maius Zn]
MPAQEVNQPQVQQMDIPLADAAQQPKPAEQMTAEPVSMRGGGEGEDVCCGICAGLACFECLSCCC